LKKFFGKINEVNKKGDRNEYRFLIFGILFVVAGVILEISIGSL
jgi:hypothetical protein